MPSPVVGNTTQYSTTHTLPGSFATPATPAVDDMLVICIVRNNTTDITSVACSAGASPNFSSIGTDEAAPSGSSARTEYWYKRCQGDEGGTISFNGTGSASQRTVTWCALITGVDWNFNSGVPIFMPANADKGSSRTSIDPPSVSVGSSKDILVLAHCWDLGPAITFPASYSTVIGTGTLTSTGLNHVLGSRAMTASSEDPGAFTMSNTSGLANTIILVGKDPSTFEPLMQTSGSFTARLGGKVGLMGSVQGRASLTVPAPADTSVMGVVSPASAINSTLNGKVGVGGPLSTNGQFTAVLGLLNSAVGGFARLYPGLGARKFPDVNSRGYPK